MKQSIENLNFTQTLKDSSNDNLTGLSANTLKLIALISMTVDHIGMVFFTDLEIFRIIGRVSFPIFAYMIAEGCLYTKNMRLYFWRIFLLGLLCQVVYFFTENSVYQCILITFSLSVLLIYTLQWVQKHRRGWWLLLSEILFVYLLTSVLPKYLPQTDFEIDYGFWGVMLPFCIYSMPDRRTKTIAAGFVLIALSISSGKTQWWCLLSLLLLTCYNGQRGKRKMKKLFYIYYPLHLTAIYLIDTLISTVSNK